MRVAINANVIGTSPGYRQAGVSTYVTQLLRHFWSSSEAGGIEWTVYAPAGVTRELLNAPDCVSIRHPRLPTSRPVPRIFWEQCVAPCHVALRRPDVLFCPLNVVPLMAACPTVVSVMDLAFIRYPTHRLVKNAYLRAMTRASVRRAKHVLAISEFTRREVIHVMGCHPKSVTAVPLAQGDCFRPQSAEAIESVRRKYGLPMRFLLSVGTLEPRKNLATLLRAYSTVRNRLDMPLFLAGGKGWGHDSLSTLMHQLGIQNDVRFTGFMPPEDLPACYAAATAFVYPSIYEGFGLPPLEAMGVGTPVITSDADSLTEVGGDAVISVPAMDAAALAAAMLQVVEDATLRDRMRAGGLVRAAEYSWQRTADETLKILRRAAKPSRTVVPGCSGLVSLTCPPLVGKGTSSNRVAKCAERAWCSL